MKLQRTIKTPIQLANTATFISKMEIPEDGLVITVKDYEEVRTLEQNKFLWSQLYQPCAEQIGEATGAMLTKDDMHLFFTRKFGARVNRMCPVRNTKISVPKSTTKYTRKEMSDYLEECFAWGATNGVWFQ
jgi:hypothetical protein